MDSSKGMGGIQGPMKGGKPERPPRKKDKAGKNNQHDSISKADTPTQGSLPKSVDYLDLTSSVSLNDRDPRKLDGSVSRDSDADSGMGDSLRGSRESLRLDSAEDLADEDEFHDAFDNLQAPQNAQDIEETFEMAEEMVEVPDQEQAVIHEPGQAEQMQPAQIQSAATTVEEIPVEKPVQGRQTYAEHMQDELLDVHMRVALGISESYEDIDNKQISTLASVRRDDGTIDIIDKSEESSTKFFEGMVERALRNETANGDQPQKISDKKFEYLKTDRTRYSGDIRAERLAENISEECAPVKRNKGNKGLLKSIFKAIKKIYNALRPSRSQEEPLKSAISSFIQYKVDNEKDEVAAIEGAASVMNEGASAFLESLKKAGLANHVKALNKSHDKVSESRLNALVTVLNFGAEVGEFPALKGISREYSEKIINYLLNKHKLGKLEGDDFSKVTHRGHGRLFGKPGVKEVERRVEVLMRDINMTAGRFDKEYAEDEVLRSLIKDGRRHHQDNLQSRLQRDLIDAELKHEVPEVSKPPREVIEAKIKELKKGAEAARHRSYRLKFNDGAVDMALLDKYRNVVDKEYEHLKKTAARLLNDEKRSRPVADAIMVAAGFATYKKDRSGIIPTLHGKLEEGKSVGLMKAERNRLLYTLREEGIYGFINYLSEVSPFAANGLKANMDNN